MSKEELLELLKKSLQDALDSIQGRDKEELNEEKRTELKDALKNHFEFLEVDKTEDFLKKYSPWDQAVGIDLIKKFVGIVNSSKADKDFSWLDILNDDKQWKKPWKKPNEEVKIKNEVKDKNKHVNMRYQIPTHFHGDIDNAVLFHCMENPRGYLGEYEDSYIDKELGGPDLEEYFGKTYKLLNEDNSSNKSIKEIIKERYQLGEGKLDKNITNIIYSDKSNLSRELDNMFNESKDFFTKEYTLKKNNRSKKDDLSERYYYLAQYYAQLLEIDGKNMRKLDDEPGNEDTEGRKKARKIAKKICNLEIYPFSCKDPKLGNNGIGEKILLNSDLSRLSAYIVLRRIYKYLEDYEKSNEKPVFIFRKYDRAWEKLFKEIFGEAGVKDEFLQDLESHFFYCQTSQQGGGVTSGNVISVRDFKALELLKELAFRDIFDLITEKKD